MRKLLILTLLISVSVGMVFAITAEDILMNIDKNMTAKTTWSSSRMIISTRRATRTLSSVNYSKGNDISYSEYTAPAKEKGTKMLKMKDNLWLYDPSTDRVIQISGNMLKQSVMGSDLSYEDFMDDLELLESYTAILDNDITYDNRKCYKLILTAKTSGLSYFKRILYVDKERMIPLYQELYAKSGIKLKTMKLSDVRKVGNRWYPMHIVFKDELKAGSGTTIINDDIEFNISIPDYYFSKAILKK